ERNTAPGPSGKTRISLRKPASSLLAPLAESIIRFVTSWITRIDKALQVERVVLNALAIVLYCLEFAARSTRWEKQTFAIAIVLRTRRSHLSAWFTAGAAHVRFKHVDLGGAGEDGAEIGEISRFHSRYRFLRIGEIHSHR